MRGRAAVALVLSVTLLAVAGGPVRADVPAPHPASMFEVRFMQDMIDHHLMAVMMADMCQERSVHPELEALCEEIIAAQSAEIATMQGWLADWYGITYDPDAHMIMNPGQARHMEEMMALGDAEFEVAFMREMIQHHRQAIREAERVGRKACHPQLVAMANEIVATQSAEITQMEAWLCEWYDLCRGRQS